MAEVSETLRAEIKRYQDLVERLRLIALNKQQLQAQLSEVDEALRELSSVEDTQPVYKISGSIMVLKNKSVVLNELNSLKEALEVRVKTLEKQEDLLKKQLDELEKKLARKLGGATQTGAG